MNPIGCLTRIGKHEKRNHLQQLTRDKFVRYLKGVPKRKKIEKVKISYLLGYIYHGQIGVTDPVQILK